MRWPASMPAGICTLTLRSATMRPAPSAFLAGRVDDLPLPWQRRQTARLHHLSQHGAAHGAHCPDRRTRSTSHRGRVGGARAFAVRAGGVGSEADLFLHPEGGFLERQLDLDRQVLAWSRPGGPGGRTGRTAEARRSVEDVLEDVAETGEAVEAGCHPPPRRSPSWP